jgi:hypothetical protein
MPTSAPWPATVRCAVRGCVVTRVAEGAPDGWHCREHHRPHRNEARAALRRIGVDPFRRPG